VRVHSRRVVTPAATIEATVSVADGRITAVTSGRDGEAMSCGDRWLIPGLIDTHVHGGAGAQCNTSSADEVAAVAAFHASHGTTGLLATTVSAGVDELEGSLRAIGAAGVLGAHLEGPFLSMARPGAMDPASFLEPSAGVLGRLLAAGGGFVSMMTIAPELPGALEVIATLADRGVVASLGHSDAEDSVARAAVRAGARSVTHLFNAMAPLHQRRPGLVGAALDGKELRCELICDGVHVDPAVMRLALRAKGVGGLRLVTDAISAAGMGDGEYRLGDAEIHIREGRATLADDDEVIAGSTLTMDAALANAVRFLGVTVGEAVRMGSANPAALLGLQDRKGAIAAGYDADLAVLDEDLRACATMVGGRWVGGPPAWRG
jgi:N-acetylglucosamine-6-phosphate deacetylase